MKQLLARINVSLLLVVFMANMPVSAQTYNADDEVIKISEKQLHVLTSQVNTDISDPTLTKGQKIDSIDNALLRLRSAKSYPLQQAKLIVKKYELTGMPYSWRTALSLADQYYIADQHSDAHKFFQIFHSKAPALDTMKYQDSVRLDIRRRGNVAVLSAMIESAKEAGDVRALRNLTELKLSKSKYDKSKRYKAPGQRFRAKILRDLITQSISLNDTTATKRWANKLHGTLSSTTEDYFFQPLSEDKFYNEVKDALLSSGHAELADKIYTIPRRNDATNIKQKLIKLDTQCRNNKKQACAEISDIYAKEYEFGEQAFEANKRACELNYAHGCYYAGRKLREGGIVERDINAARELLQKACDLKDAGGCGQYGLILKYHGIDGVPDKKKAKRMFKKSCRLETDITYCIDAKYLK